MSIFDVPVDILAVIFTSINNYNDFKLTSFALVSKKWKNAIDSSPSVWEHYWNLMRNQIAITNKWREYVLNIPQIKPIEIEWKDYVKGVFKRHKIYLVKEDTQNSYCRLIRVISQNNIKKLKKHIAKGVDLNPTFTYRTPLLAALLYPHLMKLLIEYGAAPSCPWAMKFAIEGKCEESIEILKNYRPVVKHWTLLREEIDNARTDPAWRWELFKYPTYWQKDGHLKCYCQGGCRRRRSSTRRVSRYHPDGIMWGNEIIG